MIADLEPYPAMKDSGVEWLGEVPEHWDVVPLRRATLSRCDGPFGSGLKSSHYSSAGVRVVRLQNIGHGRFLDGDAVFIAENYYATLGDHTVQHRDLLIAGLGDEHHPAGRACVAPASILPAMVKADCFRFRISRARANVDFLALELTSTAIASSAVLSRGATRQRVNLRSTGTREVALPPLPEQAAIVRYLDHVDRRVRWFVRAKQKLIGLLEEQKQAIIHHAVTRGLDPDVPLKDSDVEWLGEVPEHWEVRKLGRLIRLTTGFPFKSEGFSQSEGDTRLLRGVNISLGRLRWTDVVRWPASDRDAFSEFELLVVDIVLGMDRPIIRGGIRVASVAQEDVPSLLLQRVARIRPLADLDARLLLLVLAGRGFMDYLAPIFTGVSVPHLSPEQIRSFRMALPCLPEQAAIVEYLDEASVAIDTAIDRARREIELLREYRTRLIADVVTGKLDVRDAATRLPVEPDEAEALQSRMGRKARTESPRRRKS